MASLKIKPKGVSLGGQGMGMGLSAVGMSHLVEKYNKVQKEIQRTYKKLPKRKKHEHYCPRCGYPEVV